MDWPFVIDLGFTFFGVTIFALWLRYVTSSVSHRARTVEEQAIARKLNQSVWIVFWSLIVLPCALRLMGLPILPAVVFSLLLIWALRFWADRKLRALRQAG